MRIVLHRQPEIEVINSDGILCVYMDDDCQGRARFEDGRIFPISPFYNMITAFLGFLEEKPKNILYIGGGACIVPTFMYQMYHIIGTVVEPSKFMRDIAVNTFHFHNELFNVSPLDGMSFLRSDKTKYDAIILDAFNGYTPDNDLYSWQGYTLCRERLNDNGLLISNYISSSVTDVQRHGMCLGSVFNEYGGSHIEKTVPHQCVMWAREFPLTFNAKPWTLETA